MTYTVREARLPADRAALLATIDEYLIWLDMDLSYRGFDAEMAAFDRLFTLPSGMFFLAENDREVAGCVGFLRHPGNRAEVKRLFVRPGHRGHGLGKRMVDAVITKTRNLGFSRLILDAVPQTVFAMRLYDRMGFQPSAPFYDGAVPGTKFYEMQLSGWRVPR